MGRNKADRKIGLHSEDQMQKALDAIKAGKSIRTAAQEHNIAFSTVQRYNKKENLDRLTPNYSVRKIFGVAHEEALCEYFKKCALMFYGLTTRDCRQIAYEMAKMNNLPVPESWEKNKMAGVDWLRGFRERFPDMSLRRPENCSLARATSFNQETVKTFFDNLYNVLSRSPHFADGTRIYNLDETATGTVHKNPRVLAPKGKRNICKVTSGEKGTLVTTCNIISAGGVALPPALVFPRKNVNPRMRVGTPPGSLILASPTGWMNTETFVEVMKHFVQRSGSTKDSPTVLIMDNHESHLSIEALDLAKESGVTVLTLHPHTSAKLQPLDVGIHGPFKTYYASAMESWMMRNPGCPVTIYEIGTLVGQAFEKSMTPVNIKNSFKKTGIYPFDRNIFSEEDFMPSSVTDRPAAEEPTAFVVHNNENSTVPNKEAENIVNEIYDRDEDTPSPSVIDAIQQSSVQSPVQIASTAPVSVMLSSEVCATNPLSLSRLAMTAITQPASTIPLVQSQDNQILHSHSSTSPSGARQDTDETSARLVTPVQSQDNQILYSHSSTPPSGARQDINEISATSSNAKINLPARLVTPDEFRKPLKAAARNNKRKPRRLGKSLIATDTPEKDEIEKKKKAIKRKKVSKSTGKKAVRKVLQSDSEEDCEIVLNDDSPDEGSWLSDEEDNVRIVTQESLMKPLPRMPREGEYVLVEFASKRQILYYVAKVLEERNDTFELYVSYLRHKKGRFSMPNTPDLAFVKDDNIKLLLPTPTSNGSTARQQSYLTFSVDLSGLNIR